MNCILGIHCGHNSSAALMIDGRIIGAVQEERFTNIKNQVAFPRHSIEWLLQEFGTPDQVVFATAQNSALSLCLRRYCGYTVADHVAEQHGYWRHAIYHDASPDYWRDMYLVRRLRNITSGVDIDALMDRGADADAYFNEHLRHRLVADLVGSCPQVTIDHHSCHAHYAFWGLPIPSGVWSRTLVLTADSWGDGANWSAWRADDRGELMELGRGTEHGVARVYRNVTLILGMLPLEHEYKVMGLAGYASVDDPRVSAVALILKRALTFFDGKFVSEQPLRDGYFDLQARLEGHRFDHIAAGLQQWATETTVAWARHWIERTGAQTLALSGGLSMNIKINQALARLVDLYVPGSGGDETTALGACFAATQERAPLASLYLGPMPGPHGLPVTPYEPSDIAALIHAGLVGARCVGRLEFGARALGNRSIIAAADRPEHVVRINSAVKHRDFWMPFTPAITDESLIVGPASRDMTIACDVVPHARQKLAATTHPGDGTVRPQLVQPGEFADLVSACGGALLNTSLNVHGEPMNARAVDAINTVTRGGLDFLILPDGLWLRHKHG